MEIKLLEDSVHKVLPKEVFTSEQIWSILSDALPEKDCIFAAFSTAPGMYVWTLPGDGWVPVSRLDASMAEMVRDMLGSKRRSVVRALLGWPDLWIEALFTIPSDDYFFIRTESDGQIRIMLAAWDYVLLQKQEGMEGKVKGDRPETRQDVTLLFIEADEPVSGYGLRLQLADGSWAEKKTDDNGRFAMPGLEIGKHFHIMSLDGSRDYSFTVEEGRSLIVHDLTGPVTVEVEVTRDDAPSDGLPVLIAYEGREHEVVTGADGVARLAVPYRRGAQVKASVEGKEDTAPAAYPLTRLSIALFTKQASIIVEYCRGGDPVPDQSILVRVTGMEDIVLRTDLAGRASCTVPFREKSYVVAHSGCFVDKKYLQDVTRFRFVEEIPVELPKPEPEREPEPEPEPPEPEVDDYGNPKGDNYDLEKDRSMKGYRIVIFNLPDIELEDPVAALKRKGFSVLECKYFSLARGYMDLEHFFRIRRAMRWMKKKKTQLWVIATQFPRLEASWFEPNCVDRFFNKGQGVYFFSDNDPFYVDTNIILARLFGSEMSGNYHADQILSVQPSEGAPGIIKDHPISTGIRNLYEGITISKVKITGGLRPLVYSSDGNVVTAYYEKDGKRALVDGGYTRLYCNWNSAGTDRFVVNCACWLAGKG